MKINAAIVVGFLSISLGCAIFFTSQISCIEGARPIFSTTVTVPFNDHAKPEYFYTSASLEELASYVIVFRDSDLQIDSVNITAPNNDMIVADQDFSFRTATGGAYTFQVACHYLLLPDIGTPPPSTLPDSARNSYGKSGGSLEWEHNIFHGSRQAKENIDDTVDVHIFKLEEKPEYVHPYSSLWPAALGLWGIGAIVSITATIIKRKKV